ncbi:MAG: alpha/beta hydrolase [Clostridia bacterium]|nr:alpha/beta hydrolase [Clostridia bacterium]
MFALYIGIAATVVLLLVFVPAYLLFVYAVRKSTMLTPEQLIERLKARHKSDEIKSQWGYMAEEGYKKLLKQPLEDVYITSRDGLKLHATLIETENATKTVIFSHGWRSHAFFDFSCIWEYYLSHKFNVLLIDHRAHGKSEGKYICFGIKERYDLIDWANFINLRFGTHKKIFFSGLSMGSATVMMALGTEGLPSNVVGASCDCGYTSPKDIFKHVLKSKFHLPSFPFINVASLISKLTARFDFDEFSSEEGLKKAKVPIIFIHGTEDGFVPIEHTYRNMKSCASEYSQAIIENAGHGMSYLTDKESVIQKIEALLKSLFEDF